MYDIYTFLKSTPDVAVPTIPFAANSLDYQFLLYHYWIIVVLHICPVLKHHWQSSRSFVKAMINNWSVCILRCELDLGNTEGINTSSYRDETTFSCPYAPCMEYFSHVP